MAHRDELDEDVINGIIEQIEERLPLLIDSASAGVRIAFKSYLENNIEPEIHLAESYPLWMVGAEDVAKTATDAPKKTLAQISRWTGRWHHQIHFDHVACAFARSMPIPNAGKGLTITELFISRLAKAIDISSDWIDRLSHLDPRYQFKSDPYVSLLTIPAYQVDAFWLTDYNAPDCLSLIRLPKSSRLMTNRLYTVEEFFSELFKDRENIGYFRFVPEKPPIQQPISPRGPRGA
jgi:hypothetical protein